MIIQSCIIDRGILNKENLESGLEPLVELVARMCSALEAIAEIMHANKKSQDQRDSERKERTEFRPRSRDGEGYQPSSDGPRPERSFGGPRSFGGGDRNGPPRGGFGGSRSGPPRSFGGPDRKPRTFR